ncbi:choline kinase [Virgisporangium aliadipatigenens]|uniref:Choline kinase n=1 Tax=Virgisporangium aliadipatigenens TaxID=741659 RepID=A0A8J4DQL6_9ACTN|nr:phosphotransferase [Virgisporangium aliadipatigenens]GIJ45853.1 choline kinase [Virgisporangium aliadipatigenens]
MGAGAAAVDETVARVRAWEGLPVRVSPLAGGLSHHIYRVAAAGETFVLRILDPAVAEVGLGFPPADEIANTRRAEGVGARVVEALGDEAIVLEFLPGRTLSATDIPGRTGPIAAACRRLHSGPRFVTDFDIFAKREELLGVCARHGLPLPPGYTDHTTTVARIRDALAVAPLPSVPCHNDLLAENFVESPSGEVRIIDYQLAGNNDPAFELGDIAAEADLDPDGVERLASAYFGSEHHAALLARVRLFLVASNVTWTLWFTVHSGLLSRGGDFDYAGEAADKWDRAVRDLTSPGLGHLLDTVAGHRPAAPPPAVTPLPPR